jgi:hypothetical protein
MHDIFFQKTHKYKNNSKLHGVCGRDLASAFTNGTSAAWGQFVNGGPGVPTESRSRMGCWEPGTGRVNGDGFARAEATRSQRAGRGRREPKQIPSSTPPSRDPITAHVTWRRPKQTRRASVTFASAGATSRLRTFSYILSLRIE